MAPTVVDVAATGPTGNGLGHALNLPTGTGGLLLAIVSCDGRRTGIMDGWTELFDENDNIGGSGTGGNTLCIYAKESDGSDDATFEPSSSESVSALIYRISGAEALATQPPEVVTDLQDGNTPGTSSDPPTNTPTGGAKDYLWLTGVGVDEQSITETPPTNYGNDLYVQPSTGDASLAVAYRANNAASEDAAGFSFANDTYIGFTVAVHPAAGGGGTEHTKTPTDALGLTDARARVFGKTRSEALGASDTAARVWGAIRASSDPLGLTDAQERAFQRVLVEDVGLTDQVTAQLFMLVTKVVTDGLGLTDTRLRAFDRSLADALGLSDSVARTFARLLAAEALGLLDSVVVDHVESGSFTRTVTEALGLTDTTPRTAAFQREALEALGLTDTPLRAQDWVRTLTDDEGLTDAATALLIQLITRTVTDNLGALDSVARTNLRALVDDLGLADTRVRSVTREVTDAEGLVDALTRGIERVLTEALGLTDTASALAESTLITYITARVAAEVLNQEYGVKVDPHALAVEVVRRYAVKVQTKEIEGEVE